MFSFSSFFLSLFIEVEEGEEECNRKGKGNNLLFDVSVGDLYMCLYTFRKRERKRRKLGYGRRKKRNIDLVNNAQNEIKKKPNSIVKHEMSY